MIHPSGGADRDDLAVAQPAASVGLDEEVTGHLLALFLEGVARVSQRPAKGVG